MRCCFFQQIELIQNLHKMFTQLCRIQTKTELSHVLVDLINAIPKSSNHDLISVKLKCLKSFVNSPFFEEQGMCCSRAAT